MPTLLEQKAELLVDRVTHDDGLATDVKILEFDRAMVRPELVCFDQPTRLEEYCQENNIDTAINGGFFGTQYNAVPEGEQLGELWINGEQIAQGSSSYDRGCLAILPDGSIQIDFRRSLPESIEGSLLEIGPLLVRDGKSMVDNVVDPEGFSAESTLFDGDLTQKRFPRAAIAMNNKKFWAVVCEGRTPENAGMTLQEMADYSIDLGATESLNLDGGSANSLIHKGVLQNKPCMDADRNYKVFTHGRPIKTAIIFR